jgi:hypothetical protein
MLSAARLRVKPSNTLCNLLLVDLRLDATCGLSSRRLRHFFLGVHWAFYCPWSGLELPGSHHIPARQDRSIIGSGGRDLALNNSNKHKCWALWGGGLFAYFVYFTPGRVDRKCGLGGGRYLPLRFAYYLATSPHHHLYTPASHANYFTQIRPASLLSSS